jgi:hypothetical protein
LRCALFWSFLCGFAALRERFRVKPGHL